MSSPSEVSDSLYRPYSRQRICIYPGCSKRHASRGWCEMHYARWRKHGTPDPITPEQRFLAQVEKTDTCWIWRGCENGHGYGAFGANSKQYRAHRWYYEHLYGELAKDLTIDHLCRNKLCVNPDHLEAVTQRVNSLRSNNASGLNARKTHCKNGHEFTPENTYIYPSGARRCRTCDKKYNAEYQKTRVRVR